MVRGILVAGNESALSRAIEAETINKVEQFASALIPNRLSTNAAKSIPVEMSQRISLDWNPSSPISARTLVIAAENRLEHIDEAILICSPPSIRASASAIPFSDVEIMINDNMKGWFFLVKELAAVFTERKRGTLALVFPDIGFQTQTSAQKDEAADILGPSAIASFRAFTQGLLLSAHNEPYTTAGFSYSDAGNEPAFAAYIFKTLDELTKRSNGKMHKFGKFNLFK